jgi:hypothetical protein
VTFQIAVVYPGVGLGGYNPPQKCLMYVYCLLIIIKIHKIKKKIECYIFYNPSQKKILNKPLPNSMSYEGKLSDEPLNIANLFSNCFSSVYKKLNFENPSSLHHIEDLVHCSNITISVEEVFDALSNLGFETYSGPDMLPPTLINSCRYALSKPIHYLFSLSLKTGKFSLKWKSSFITSIWKSGDRSKISKIIDQYQN